MKFKHIALIPALVGSAFLTSCKKDYLDKKPSEFISIDQLNEASKLDPELLNGNIGGLYTTMYITGTGGTTDHDDFGQKGYDIYSDMIVGDMVLGALNYGWYSPVARFQATTDYTRNEDYRPWRYYYRVVFGANIVLDALGGSEAEQTDPVKKAIAGQALAMRAYGYYYLSQLYAKGYGDGSAKILPIYKDTKVPNQPKSTTKDVYDLIIADLTKAIAYLDGFNRASKDQVDKNVAKGLLAYALAARGTNADLTQVVTLTNDILGAYPLTTAGATVAKLAPNGSVLNPESGFNNVATPSWIWGVDLTLASDLDLVSWWGQVDVFTYSYAWAGDPKLIDDGLYAAIPANDIRKEQFDVDGYPLNKFFAPARVIGGQRNVVTDYVYMRADEFLLLNAETQARLGQDGAAQTSLKKLVSIRVPDASYIDALTGAALLNEIYLQTRIELWGEGKAYLAMKRLKKSVTRGTNHLFFPGNTYAYDAAELTFPIPQAEVLNNPVLNN